MKRDMHGENNPNYGNKWTDEQKKAFSELIKNQFKNGRIPWNKGLTKSDPRVAKYVNKQKGQIRGPIHSEEFKELQRKRRIQRNIEDNPMKHKEARLKVSMLKKGKTPWNKGMHAWYVAGKLHPRWKGDDFERKDYRGPKWRIIRKEILERDGYMCAICGSKNNLVVHHIEPYYISKNNNPENLITLCRSCHIKKHNEEDYK